MRVSWTRIFVEIGVCVVLLTLPIGGGILNRIRGGYLALGNERWGNSVITHDLFGRFVWGLPTGFFLAVEVFFRQLQKPNAREILRAATIAILSGAIFFVLTTASAFTGWGAYFNTGFSPDTYRSRVGVFDWLLGSGQEDWGFGR